MELAIYRRRRLLLLKKKLLLMKIISEEKKLEKKQARRWSVHPLLRNRGEEGDYHMLMMCREINDVKRFQKYTRMSPALFDILEHLIASRIKKVHHTREVLEPGHRLAITLRFLATGNSYVSIGCAFRVGVSTVRGVVLETCAALWDILQPLYLPAPSAQTWQSVAEQFERVWQFPNCCGAVDSKQAIIQHPRARITDDGSGVQKRRKSVVLMAVVGPTYQYLAVDIGAEGSQSDGGIFKASSIGQALEQNTLMLPDDCKLPHTNTVVPHVLLGGKGFQLRSNFLRPYPGRQLDAEEHVFNCRLSRVRRCSENAFGVMVAKFRVFRRLMMINPESANFFIKAAVVLHNFLMEEEEKLAASDRVYCPPGYADFVDLSGDIVDGRWRTDLQVYASGGLESCPYSSIRSRSRQAVDVREAFKKYFSSPEGEVDWQWNSPGASCG